MKRSVLRTVVGVACIGLAGCDSSPPPSVSAAVREESGPATAAADAGTPSDAGLPPAGDNSPSVTPEVDTAAGSAMNTQAEPPVSTPADSRTTEPAESPSGRRQKTVALRVEPGTRSDDARFRDRTFDDLQFEMETDGAYDRSMLTEEIEQMFDTPIRIRGYILPTTQQHGLEQFVLVRDNQECCFGPGAALYDCIVITMDEGKTADFSVRPVTVEGVFGYEEVPGFPELGPRPLAIYHLQASDVR